MIDHVSPEAALGYADHELAETESRAVEDHIDTCQICRELISAIAKSRWSISSNHDERAPEAALPRGTVLGQFELDRPLDAGGMGMVYVARDRKLDRAVAIKAIRNAGADSTQLLIEARAMAKVAHPNVVAVYDVVEAQGRIFLAMELVVGRSLRRWLDEAPRSWRVVLAAFIEAGSGLAAAHAAGIVHGDIKPGNILVGDDGRVRITDFGLATSGDVVQSGRGTPAYMAPEQREGGPSNELADQYAFCASLYEAIYGGLPHEPAARKPNLPRVLRKTLARGLARKPSDRFASMADLLRALRTAASQRRNLVAVFVTSTLALGGVAFALGQYRSANECAIDTARLESPWTETAKFNIRRSFENTGLSYVGGIVERVEANLDRWSRELASMRDAICTDVPEARSAVVTACLEDRAQEGRAIIGLFQDTVDASAVLNAVAATEQLASPTRCRELALVPGPTTLSNARRAQSPKLSRAFALMAAGKYKDALPINRELVEAAHGDPSAEAQARVSLGRNQINTSAFDDARTTLVEALRLAEVAREDRTRVQALVNLVILEYRRGKYEQAIALHELALGAAQRLGDKYLESELYVTAGSALAQLGKPADAQPMFERAVEMRRALYGDRSPRVAAAMTALGNSYAMQGDLERARPPHRRALEVTAAALGESHPDTATMHGNLGSDELYSLHADAAVAELATAVAIYERAYQGDHQMLASGLTELGLAQLETKHFTDALATFERAEQMWAAVAAKHPARAEALLGRYLAHRGDDTPADLVDLERALELGKQLPPFERARIQWELGRALAERAATGLAGRSARATLDRGLALVDDAIAGFASSPLPLPQRELATARAWRAHPPRPHADPSEVL